MLSSDSQNCPFSVRFYVCSDWGVGGGGGEIVLNLIDILEELYQSEFFVIVSIIIVL